MRFFTVPALLAAALVSTIVALPFLPAAKLQPEFFAVEASVTSNASGLFQVFYDDGAGFREELSARARLESTTAPRILRLPLPPGSYRALRLDPLDRGGTVSLHGLRVVSQTGRTIAEIPVATLRAANQIESLRPTGSALEIRIAASSNDPQLATVFSAPVVVNVSWLENLRVSAAPLLGVFAAFAALLLLLDRAASLRGRIARTAGNLAARPGRAVGVVAALAVIGSAYPVVFLGKSYVSPNLGTVLLYDTFPTLPGHTAAETTDVKLSDIGAVMWQHVPFSMMQHRALAQGELPWWNRYNAAGVPLLAQGQSMFGDPLHLFVIAANGAAWAWDVKYLLAKWLFATGLGLTVFALARGTGDRESLHFLLPAVLVAASAPFIGFFLYRVNHPAFFSLCYAPWPLYCLVRIAHADTRRAIAGWCAALLVANLALMNSGTVKEAYMLLACVNFSGACVLLATHWPSSVSQLSTLNSPLLRKLAAVAWTGLLFVLLSAPIWATFLATLKNAYTGYNAASAYQIQPTLLLGLFDEIFYRPLMSGDRVFSPSLNFFLLLGLLYFLATLRAHFSHRAAMALAASSLLPLALAFGLISPRWIVTLPFLSNIAHLDNTFSCVLIVLWSVLAGLGFAAAARRLGTPEGRGDLIVAGLLLGALVFGWIAFRQAAHRPILGPTFSVHPPGRVLAIAPFIWDYLASLLVASIVFAVLVRGAFLRHTVSPTRGLLIAACLAMLLWRHGLHASPIGFENFTLRPTARADFHARSAAMDFARDAHAREPGRGFGMQGNFFPGWTGVYGLETVHGPDALVNPWLRELVGVSGVERIWDWRLYVEPATLATAQPFFDALNVRYYFDLLSKHPALTPALTLVKSADLDVYTSPTAWPRAFFTDRLGSYEQPAELIPTIRAAAGKPFAAAQRNDPSTATALATLPQDLATRTVTAATSYTLTENTTSFTVRATGPGAIVLSEAYWPGDFRAEIDGRKAPVLRLNHAFKGVTVDAAGEYTVTFRYVPKNFPRNLLLSVTGAVLLALSLFVALRAPRRIA
jgi:hypothetical protein